MAPPGIVPACWYEALPPSADVSPVKARRAVAGARCRVTVMCRVAEPSVHYKPLPRVGVEPTTFRFSACCSATELPKRGRASLSPAAEFRLAYRPARYCGGEGPP